MISACRFVDVCGQSLVTAMKHLDLLHSLSLTVVEPAQFKFYDQKQ